MSLNSYANACDAIGEELSGMLREPDFQPLLAQLTARSGDEAISFGGQERELVRKVASATPKPRQKLLAALPLEKRFWTIAAAAQVAYEAAAVLRAADIWMHPAGPYRDMIRNVQLVLDAPYEHLGFHWPFPGYPPDADDDEAEEDEW